MIFYTWALCVDKAFKITGAVIGIETDLGYQKMLRKDRVWKVAQLHIDARVHFARMPFADTDV